MGGPASNEVRTTDGAVTGRILYGFSVDAAAAAVVEIRHGASVAGPIVGTVRLAAAGADWRWYGPGGISCPDGIWVEVVSGTPSVSVHAG
jgi:hypothetical protein